MAKETSKSKDVDFSMCQRTFLLLFDSAVIIPYMATRDARRVPIPDRPILADTAIPGVVFVTIVQGTFKFAMIMGDAWAFIILKIVKRVD